MADAIIGQVQRVDLKISVGTHLSFDMEWWEDESYTEPIDIVNKDVSIDLNGVRYDLDALGFASVTGNIIRVVLPSVFTENLPEGNGTWRCKATDAVSSETKLLARGMVKVRS